MSDGPGLTEQQQEAVGCRDVSVVLSSGAGCGKTHVLTERFLSHLRDGLEVGQIVAITFTDRAARQMRGRIRRALNAELRAAPSEEEAERWARHLRALETASITTIHAFCGTLLRQNAVEAGVDPRFDVLEEVLAVNVEAEALTECLQGLLTAKSQEGEDLKELVLLYGWKPTVRAIQGLVRIDDGEALDRWLEFKPSEISSSWSTFGKEQLFPRWMQHVLSSANIAGCLKLLGRVKPKAGTHMAENVNQLLEKTPALAKTKDLAVAVKELVECAKVGSERNKAWETPDDYELVKAAFEGFRKDLPEKLANFLTGEEDLATAAEVSQRFARVARECRRHYARHKRRLGVVDFQDLLVLARDLLRDQADVRGRLQRRFRAVLIDELQDTDPVQCELVDHLCGAGLTQGKLFAVGDHKQSIYRFRGADVKGFLDLRVRIPHEGRLDLTLNFRSQPAILRFANALFARHLTDYVALEAHEPQVNPGACVEFLWSPRGDKEAVNEARATEADWIARRIREMIAGEKLVTDRSGKNRTLRPVRPGDVVLLFRSMSNVAIYEADLRRHGLEYYLVGGRAFFAQQEIYDVLNLLQALENPEDAVNVAGTLRSPFCCVSDEALFLLSRHADGIWAGLHDDAAVERLPEGERSAVLRARRFLDRWRDLKDRLPIARLLGEVLADSGYDAALQFEFLGDRKLANLWKLLEVARTFDRSGLFGLAEFIQRLGDLVKSQPREEQAATQPENADVVRLMTIHQAKGLEFPVVFVPDLSAVGGGASLPTARWDRTLGCVARPPADEEPAPFSAYPWALWDMKEELEDWHEDLRTLYVACTRAQDYLVLSAALAEGYKPRGAWMTVLAERFDLRSGRFLDEVAPEASPLVVVKESPAVGKASGQSRRSRSLTPLEPDAAQKIAAIPIKLSGLRCLSNSEVEKLLEAGVVDPGLGLQFDSEDGSDRTEWAIPTSDWQSPAP